MIINTLSLDALIIFQLIENVMLAYIAWQVTRPARGRKSGRGRHKQVTSGSHENGQ